MINFQKMFTIENSKYFHARSNYHGITNFTLTILLTLFILSSNIIYANIFYNIISFILIGALQHRLSIFLHECLHYTLFSSKKLNFLFGSISASLIFFNWNYRKIHLNHHKHLGEDGDPDMKNYIGYPTGIYNLILDFLSNISGFAAFKQFLSQSIVVKSNNTKNKLISFDNFLLIANQLLLLTLFIAFGKWWGYFVFWVFPLLTITKTLAHFRNVAEHVLITSNPTEFQTSRLRTIKSNFIEKFFFAPLNFNYHAEHHMFPGVPYHKLPSFSNCLRTQTFYIKNIHYYPHSYCSLLFNHTLYKRPSHG